MLRIEPHRETALPYLARTLAGLRQPDPASAVNPWRSGYRLALAQDRAQAGDWHGAVSACRDALRLNPELYEARSLLIQCCLRSGEPAKADAELQTLLLIDPAGREGWQRWYERQKQEAGPAGSSAAGKPPGCQARPVRPDEAGPATPVSSCRPR